MEGGDEEYGGGGGGGGGGGVAFAVLPFSPKSAPFTPLSFSPLVSSYPDNGYVSSVACQHFKISQVHLPQFFDFNPHAPHTFHIMCLCIYTLYSKKTGVAHGRECKYRVYCIQKCSTHTSTAKEKYACRCPGI